ncbi:uncharacterized protein Dana_GF12223 [Drosophila ananassae]|uniref:Uncharacterized protein n=1 Tax=Drosophila ananassae TaxID=7217 RepID=B3MI90_DROAN|nr:uncharacterized protein LOC6495078 [Drosophila ananassae]EDV35935.1 uncharacterized protein Dana_GF12223 [Drosophila ananassae]
MAPNDPAHPCSKAAAVAAVSGNGISYVQCQNLKYNVLILGWLGVIFSSVILCSSLLTVHLQPDIELILKQWPMNTVGATEQQVLINLLGIFSSIAYGLSLINLGVSLLLLIGIARDSSWLMYPWLIFHGLSFGFGLYLGVFYAVAGLFIDLSSFLMCLLVFTLVLVIFYKIYHEVFTLFRVMEQQSKEGGLGGLYYQDAEQGWTAAGVPYQQVYMPRLPLKQ